MLGCRGSVLEVHIIDCRNIITCGVCLPPGYYKIAHCTDCLPDCPVNEEVVVAGGNLGDSLYISNYKRGGLFANNTILIGASWFPANVIQLTQHQITFVPPLNQTTLYILLQICYAIEMKLCTECMCILVHTSIIRAMHDTLCMCGDAATD